MTKKNKMIIQTYYPIISISVSKIQTKPIEFKLTNFKLKPRKNDLLFKNNNGKIKKNGQH